MHRIDIPDHILARARRARGRDHIFARIDPVRTAHVVVDLQNGFMAEGAPLEVPAAREIVPNVNRIAAAVRDAGGINVFLRVTHDPAEPQPWSTRYNTYLSAEKTAAHKAAFTRGAQNWQLWPLLEVQPSDLVVEKTRFSGFVPGTSILHDTLQARGIDTVIVTGTLTNVCCESTARDAMQRNYGVIFVADGNAALTDAEHNATLCNMATLFADVMTTEHVLAVIAASRLPSEIRGAA
jgi:ureidoacrylate peracid hydrolase